MKSLLVLLCALCLGGIIAAGELSVKEWEQKKQDFDNFIKQHAAAVEAGEALPIKCLTPMALGVYSSNVDKGIAFRPTRPSLPLSYGTTHFLFHFAISDADAVYEANLQDSVAGIPNYIFNSGIIAEEVYAKYTAMGFDLPPSDGAFPANGGDGRYDIYFKNLGAYGVTYSDTAITPGSQSYTSFIVLDNDYAGPGFQQYVNRRLDAVRVTIAHEFFHAIQFGYDIFEYDPIPGSAYQNTSWVEMSAVFMEDYHYDAINDYYIYIPYYYWFPHWSIRFGSTGSNDRFFNMYGKAVWPIFLDAIYPSAINANVVREIWDSCRTVRGSNWWPATDGVIRRRSGNIDSLASIFAEFNVWNAFTGTRARTGEYFEEASAYYMPLLAATVNSYPSIVQVHDSLLPDNFGANYIMLNNVSSLTEGLRITFSPANGYDWILQVIGLPADVQNGTVWVDPIVYTKDDQFIPIPTAATFNKIMLIPGVVSSADSGIAYSLVLSPLGEGVFIPAGGEQWYGGETHSISWALPDSTLAIDIEYSIDSGTTWTNITRVANLSYTYNWLVPETPSNKCFVRIVDAENLAIADTSGMFSILVAGDTHVLDPYPSPAWMHMTDAVTFKAVISPDESSDNRSMKVTILNLAGEKVNDQIPVSYGTGEVTVEWGFTNNVGEKVAAGPYLAVIELGGESYIKKFMVLR